MGAALIKSGDAKELMSVNLIEVEVIYSMIGKLDEQAAVVIDNINRLTNNKVPGMVRDASGDINNVSEPDATMDFNRVKKDDGEEIYGGEPNQAPTPKKSSNSAAYAFGTMDKAEVNSQDVIQTRNQINLILLKQEKLLRDIDVMKVNTFAYVMLIDGFNKSTNLAIYDALKVYAENYSKEYRNYAKKQR